MSTKPIETSKDEIKKQYVEQMQHLHREWLHNPMTAQLLKLLANFKEQHVQALNALVGNAQIPDNFFRAQAMNVKNTDAVLNIITNTELFVELSIPQSTKE